MKIRAEAPVLTLPSAATATLMRLRALRGFDPAAWCEAKIAALLDYLTQASLSSVVLGVSGGVDSGLVAALLSRAAARPSSALRRIELLSLPSFNDAGVSGQTASAHRAQVLATALDLPLREVDLCPGAMPLRSSLARATGITPDPWAAGQGVAVLRTFALYQTASLLAQAGCPGLVAGTTNRDEGAYLGYVGKASDGMVDLQLISDLHKSEVFAAAAYMGVPAEILSAIPTGDMFDASPDTAVFGAPYDAVELLILSRTLLRPEEWAAEQAHWPSEDRNAWSGIEANLEQLHAINAHKYAVRSPAVHLDLMDSAMPGGWHPNAPESFMPPTTLRSDRPAPRVFPAGDRRQWVARTLPVAPPADTDALRVHIPQLLSLQGQLILSRELDRGLWRSANHQGRWQDGAQSHAPFASPDIGSWRTTIEDAPFAAALWETLRHYLPSFRNAHAKSRFDGHDAALWRPVGVNPVFRAIRYEAGGVLVPHYDGPFELSPRIRSGMSLVIYLDTEQAHGGDLRWIRDPQRSVPRQECDFSDWAGPPAAEEVEAVCSIAPGSAWVFDHRQLHDSSLLVSGSKVLLRTDIYFEKVGA